MHIKYIRAKNFLSIGNEGIEIDFTKYGNIINIKGDNRDVGPGASNGSGKTSILEAIVYSLYGDLMKNLNHNQIINIKNGKGLEVEIHFDLGGHEYKVIRRRKPDELALWKDGVDESVGGIPATQEEINRIIKLNYTAFINIVCFGQHNNKQFLACKPSDKRAIAENLLSLDMYNKYCKLSKDKHKDLQEKLKYLVAVYDKVLQDVATGERQVKQLLKQQSDWKTAQLNAIERLKCQQEKADSEMAKLVVASPDSNYERLQTINLRLEQEGEKKAKLTESISLAADKIVVLKEESQTHLLSIKEAQYAITKIKKEVEEIQNHSHNLLAQEGGICKVCFGIIDPANFQDVIRHNEESINKLTEELDIQEYNRNAFQNKRNKIEDYLMKLKNVYEDLKSQEAISNKALRDLEQKKAIVNSAFHKEANTEALLLEQQIENIREQIEYKQRELLEGDPYGIVFEDTKSELDKTKHQCGEFKVEITALEKQAPYYEFWIQAFGDTGIRSFVLGEIVPILNARINYWLQFLVDNKIQLSFDNELEERIERNPPDGDPFVYNAMSGGEHQRINLAISLAFAQVMMLTASTRPSIVCLDEVGANLDRPGIQAVYNTICELSKDQQVLVTTHDPDLLEMLQSYDTINVIKEDGFTRLQD